MFKVKNILFVQKEEFLQDHYARLEKKLTEEKQNFKLYFASKFEENKDYSFLIFSLLQLCLDI